MSDSKSKQKGRYLGWKEFLLALFLMLLVWASQQLFGGGSVQKTSGNIRVAFTAPDTTADYSGGLESELAQAIDEAEVSVDVAAYDFDLERVADALVRAQARDVQVRLVTDTDYADEEGPTILMDAGIPVVFDDRETFMHNKFVVIDEKVVWTGSWNLTINGTYRNDNNVVSVESEAIAKNYTVEFEEMFLEGEFGAESPSNTPYSTVEINGVLVENYFAPEEDAQSQILEIVQGAKSSIRFMAFLLTDDEIAKALNHKVREGVQVQGVVESRNAGILGSDVEALQEAGVDLLLDGNPYNMHHKVIIVDESIVITGSYNFTRSAATDNDENVLILHAPKIAEIYRQEFEEVYEAAREAQ